MLIILSALYMCQNNSTHLKKALICLLALNLALACNRPEEASLPREIHFAASMGQYEVKANETAFDIHDCIGLSVGTPVSVSNLRMEAAATELVPEYAIFWGENQADNQTADFYAYYPYSPAWDLAAGFEFAINPDQSEDGYTSSDLMTAVVSAAPKDQFVRLPFRHRLSRLILQIDNQLSSEISQVYVGNIYGKVLVKGNQELELLGHPGTVKAGWYVLPDGQSVLALVLPPQTTAPKLMITTEDEKQYTYEVDEEVSFASGYSYLATITLNNGDMSSNFTSEVTEWVNDSDIQFMLGSFTEVFNGEDGDEFTVTGRVGTLQNLDYGNFILYDAQGQSLRVYGTLDSEGKYPRDADSDLLWMNEDFSLLPGDVVTVKGKKSTKTTGVDLVGVTIVRSSKKSVGIIGDDVAVGRTGGMHSFYVRLSQPDKLQISTEDSWMSSFEGPFPYTGDWYMIRFMYEANFLNGSHNYSYRRGVITLTDGVTQVRQSVLQQPYPIPMRSLQAVADAEDGTIISITRIVHAVSSRSYVLYDGETPIQVYVGANGHSCKVGDMVTTVGTKTTYQGVPEVSNVETITVRSSDNDLFEVTYQDITSSFDTFASEVSVPVQVEGVLSITAAGRAYVKIDGMDMTCFVYWYPDVASIQNLNGQKVTVKGFYFGADGSYKDIVATSVSGAL